TVPASVLPTSTSGVRCSSSTEKPETRHDSRTRWRHGGSTPTTPYSASGRQTERGGCSRGRWRPMAADRATLFDALRQADANDERLGTRPTAIVPRMRDLLDTWQTHGIPADLSTVETACDVL